MNARDGVPYGVQGYSEVRLRVVGAFTIQAIIIPHKRLFVNSEQGHNFCVGEAG